MLFRCVHCIHSLVFDDLLMGPAHTGLTQAAFHLHQTTVDLAVVRVQSEGFEGFSTITNTSST